jgi:hypothetical protein
MAQAVAEIYDFYYKPLIPQGMVYLLVDFSDEHAISDLLNVKL